MSGTARGARLPAVVPSPVLPSGGPLELAVAVSPELVEAVARRAVELLAERTAEPEPWIAVPAAAEHIAAPTSRVYALASAGRIPCVRDGSRLLFRRSALDAWLAGGGGVRP
ncbi:MAG: helix-turn-helix domain-containing protein [Solirubrobacteraceae bacterium]